MSKRRTFVPNDVLGGEAGVGDPARPCPGAQRSPQRLWHSLVMLSLPQIGKGLTGWEGEALNLGSGVTGSTLTIRLDQRPPGSWPRGATPEEVQGWRGWPPPPGDPFPLEAQSSGHREAPRLGRAGWGGSGLLGTCEVLAAPERSLRLRLQRQQPSVCPDDSGQRWWMGSQAPLGH